MLIKGNNINKFKGKDFKKNTQMKNTIPNMVITEKDFPQGKIILIKKIEKASKTDLIINKENSIRVKDFRIEKIHHFILDHKDLIKNNI